jgi:spore coat protein CotH
METRLRGRNSLGLLKKSYKVKFDKKATSVFGQSGNKNWALVANYIDISNLRNYLAYTFASTLSFEFSPNCYFVNLTMNGEEMGLYLLVESIEASPVRVDLQENPEAKDFDTGFILEETNFITESNFVENLDYIEVGGHLYEIQYPKIDDDDIDPSNYGMIILYIMGYVASVHDAIFGGDFNRFKELCDVESFVDFMVVQETFKNLDAYMASCYFHKKPGGKLTMGPVWDFDRSVGSYDAYDLYYADGIYAEKHGGGDGNWFYSLWKTPQFKTLFKERVTELYETEMQFIINLVEPTMFYIYDSAAANFEIWDIETALQNDAKHTLKDLTEFGEQCGFVKYFLTARIEWLYEYCRK